MEYKYYMYDSAKQDIRQIVEYIKNKIKNPQAATAFKERMKKAIDAIRVFPKANSKIKDNRLYEESRRKIADKYIIIYEVDEATKTIYIVRIIHSLQNIC